MSTEDLSPMSERFFSLTTGEQVSVLHVDDEPDFADLASIYLERADSSLEVITETSAEAGLEQLADTHIDCIVSDYDMPRTNGLAFLEAVREDYPHLPFILFTGKGDEEIASEAISAGVTDYLQKGNGTDQYTVLANRITNAVRQYLIEQEIDRGFQAIETTREGLSLLDEEGKFIYVNQAYAKTYGYDREEMIGEHWELLYPNDHVDQVHDEILPNVPTNGRWEGENIHLKKDGTRLTVDHALAYTDSGSMICSVRDITEEKEVQRALKEKHRHLEFFVDSVEEYAIFELDPDGYVTSWNQGAERIKGYETEEILGKHFSTFYPDEKTNEGYPDELLENALEDGQVTDKGWRVRKDGSQFWADVTITAIFDENDQHRGFLKVTKEITDQYKTQHKLEEEQRFIEQALNVLKDGFYVLDSNGSISRVTDRVVEVTGYSEEELLSMNPTELFPEDQRAQVQAKIEEVFTEGSAELEAPILTKGGQTIPYEFRKSRLTNEDGNVIGAVGIGRNRTEHKRQKRRLQRQLDQFEHFGSVISHDLRTPLRTIEGRIELAQETKDVEHLDQTKAALERLDMLIDDLATVMREGEFVNDLTTVDIGECVRDVWDALPTEDERLQIDETAQIRCDENAVTRMLENLLKSALDHGGDTVTVGVLSDGFYLEDNGPGLPEDIRDEIFELGYSTKSSDDGSGFGLASAHQIAIAHGWDITATEGLNGGARFEITDVEFTER